MKDGVEDFLAYLWKYDGNFQEKSCLSRYSYWSVL